MLCGKLFVVVRVNDLMVLKSVKELICNIVRGLEVCCCLGIVSWGCVLLVEVCVIEGCSDFVLCWFSVLERKKKVWKMV